MGWLTRSSEEWGEDFENKPVKTTFKVIGIIFGVIVVLSVAVWAIGVAFSWWGGEGDAYQQKNSAQNWITAQKQFHQDQNDVIADQAKIIQAKNNLAQWKAANPAPSGDPIAYEQWSKQESQYQVALTGPQQSCLNSVSDYNTNAQSYLTQDWRDASLPESLPTSDCN